MVLGDDARFVQRIQVNGFSLLAYPLAVEPVADLAMLGALDGQFHSDAAEAFERYCEATPAIRLATEEFPFGRPVPAHVFAHTGHWITGGVTQFTPYARSLALETDEAIKGGTSGSPVVTDDGLLLGVVSSASGPASDPARKGSITRPHLAAPVWLVRQMRQQKVIAEKPENGSKMLFHTGGRDEKWPVEGAAASPCRRPLPILISQKDRA